MEFKVVIDGNQYSATKENINEYMEDVIFSIKHISESSANNFQIISNSKEIYNYVLKRIIEVNSGFEKFDLAEIKDLSLRSFWEKAENTPLIVYGFEEYMDYINKEYYSGEQCQICGRTYKKSQKNFYTALELVRDSFFAKFKTRLIFIMTEEEYEAFINLADDFASYYPENFDFNQVFYSDEYPDESLSEYLIYIKRGLKTRKKEKVE